MESQKTTKKVSVYTLIGIFIMLPVISYALVPSFLKLDSFVVYASMVGLYTAVFLFLNCMVLVGVVTDRIQSKFTKEEPKPLTRKMFVLGQLVMFLVVLIIAFGITAMVTVAMYLHPEKYEIMEPYMKDIESPSSF